MNEDLAATSVWGSQQTNLYKGARYDGVYSIWYGKGPGVDRCLDVFKHANAAGTSAHGGVLATFMRGVLHERVVRGPVVDERDVGAEVGHVVGLGCRDH